MDKIALLADQLKRANKITVLSGAGISVDSGIPDFKSTDKSWPIPDIPRSQAMSIGFFRLKPKVFWEIYKDVFHIKLIGGYEPNYGHIFLKELQDMGKDVHVFTQNVDGLHSKSGVKNVYEVHGTLEKSTCPKCKKEYDLEYINKNDIPRCEKHEHMILEPGIVLFGSAIKYYDDCVEHSVDSDVFMVLGSSLQVRPISDVPSYVKVLKRKNVSMWIINDDSTEHDHLFDHVVNDKIVDVFKQVKSLM